MKGIKFLVFAFLVGCTSLENAPVGDNGTFVKFYSLVGDNFGKAVDLTNDGGYIVAGYNVPSAGSNPEMVVYKLDRLGNIENQYTATGQEARFVKTVQGGFLVIGDRLYEGDEDDLSAIHAVYLDNSLNVISTTESITSFHDQDSTFDLHGYTITDLSEDEAILLGTRETSSDTDNLVMARINYQNGTLVWQRDYGSNEFNEIPANGIHLSGTEYLFTYTSSKNVDDNTQEFATVIKIQDNWEGSSGGEDLGRSTGGSEKYAVAEIKPLNTSSFGVVGTTTETIDGNGAGEDIMFFKTDPDGRIWKNSVKIYVGPEDDLGLSIDPTRDGGFIILGTRETRPGSDEIGRGGHDYRLIKTDGSGNMAWDRIFGSEGEEGIRISGNETEKLGMVRQTPDGGYIIFGSSEFSGVYNFIVMKTDKDGNIK